MMEKRKRKKTLLEERLEADPELRAAFEGLEERVIESIKRGYRERLERERREAERQAQEERRRARIRRLTFGLLPR
jgi:hypothetical protein